jgi:hypothetical protein
MKIIRLSRGELFNPSKYYKPRRWMVIGPFFSARALMLGTYWTKDEEGNTRIYACIFPTLVLIIMRYTDTTLNTWADSLRKQDKLQEAE